MMPTCDLRMTQRDHVPMCLVEAVLFRALDRVLNWRGRYRDGCPVPSVAELRSGRWGRA